MARKTRAKLDVVDGEIIEENALSEDLKSALATASHSDLIALLLADKKSANTREAYRRDLVNFFDNDASPEAVGAFLALPVPGLALRLALYKNTLRDKGEAEATINRRLAAVRSLLKYAHRLGQCASFV